MAAGGTRTRILEAARELLSGARPAELSMEAVARRADVSRLTIYYQFKSRSGMLEALYDHLAMRGSMQRMAEVFQEADPYAALDKLVGTFVGFWASDPVVIRRLRGMTALDAEVSQGIQARDERRRHAAQDIVRRIALHEKKHLTAQQMDLSAGILSMLTSFESYDGLARCGHTTEAITAVLGRLARAALLVKAV